MGNRHPISAPFGAFKARDVMFMLAVLNDKLMKALSVVIEDAAIISNPLFAYRPAAARMAENCLPRSRSVK